jgi:uncharacterized protein with NRDE domain
MCLLAFSLAQHPRYPLLLAANRDEFFVRAAVPLAWWPGDQLLGGRDLQAGGSWLMLDRGGRLAMLTNVREPGREQAGLASRGELPLLALQGGDALALAGEPRNGFNLLQIDSLAAQARWISNRPQPREQDLGSGLYGLSNAALDTPWPKLLRLKQRVAAALDDEDPEAALFAALADGEAAPDAQLPDTGIGLQRERALSSPFIRIAGADDQAIYGTRCSTLVIAERQGEGLRIRVIERRFSSSGTIAGESREDFSCG